MEFCVTQCISCSHVLCPLKFILYNQWSKAKLWETSLSIVSLSLKIRWIVFLMSPSSSINVLFQWYSNNNNPVIKHLSLLHIVFPVLMDEAYFLGTDPPPWWSFSRDRCWGPWGLVCCPFCIITILCLLSIWVGGDITLLNNSTSLLHCFPIPSYYSHEQARNHWKVQWREQNGVFENWLKVLLMIETWYFIIGKIVSVKFWCPVMHWAKKALPRPTQVRQNYVGIPVLPLTSCLVLGN